MCPLCQALQYLGSYVLTPLRSRVNQTVPNMDGKRGSEKLSHDPMGPVSEPHCLMFAGLHLLSLSAALPTLTCIDAIFQ